MLAYTVSRYSQRLRETIVTYVRSGLSVSQIRKLILKRNRIKTSCNSLTKFVKYFKETGSIQRRKPPVGYNRKLKNGHVQFINKWITEDNEITAHQIVKKLRAYFGLAVSVSAVKVIRKKLGFTYKKVAYCQLISHTNKIVRRECAVRWWAEKEEFSNVIFVDESTVEMNSPGYMSDTYQYT